MNSEDSISDSEDYTEPASGLDGLLHALAKAPRVDALPIAASALPDSVALPILESQSQLPRTLKLGDIIDARYRIEETLGAGGMGIVYGATQLATGRKVALKWMQSAHGYRGTEEHAGAFQRFLREAQATARIHHPNVVNVYDAGQDPEKPYLVMERLSGETLRARIERSVFTWADAMSVFLPILQGVGEAHRSGVVHRDLKPDNVFLAREAEHVVPKVLDFGVSRLRSGDELPDGEPSLTRTGTVLGTPAYMALEQLRGVGIDARTDVYALGVVLYEMLSGKRPFEARNAADFAAVIASENPTPLSRHRSELRGAREAVVMKALARKREDRHVSVEAFAGALRKAERRKSGPWWWVAAALIVVVGVSLALQWHRAAPAQTSRFDSAEAASAESKREELPGAAAIASTPSQPSAAAQPTSEPVVQPTSKSVRRPTVAMRPAERVSGPIISPSLRLHPSDFRDKGGPSAIAPGPGSGPSLRLDRKEF